MKPKFLLPVLAFALHLIPGCVGTPEGIKPVNNFDLSRYLGNWFEIARLDHSFERGLSHVSATYTLREDGGVNVLNRGYNHKKKEWKEARGKAYFVESPDIGQLKVSFFGPFYGGYNIIALDQDNYDYAMVCGPNREYLWILARQPRLAESISNRLIVQAKQLGFDTEQLIIVDHSPVEE